MKGHKVHKGIRERKASFFCLVMTVVFIGHWLLFWVVGNLNSIRMAFTHYQPNLDKHVIYSFPELFTNFSNFAKDVFSMDTGKEILNGFYFQSLSSFICMPMGYFVAFIIYKKVKGSEVFKVILYLPAILSGMLVGLLYKHLIESGISATIRENYDPNFPYLFAHDGYNRLMLTIYTLYLGFPMGLLINLGTMSRIPKDLVEYGELEGLSYFQEFCKLTLPLVYPVLEVQCMGMFVNMFLNQGPLFLFYGYGGPNNLRTFGYKLFVEVMRGDNGGALKGEYFYGYNSAANLLIGLVSIPIVQGTKMLFDKFDPGAEF